MTITKDEVERDLNEIIAGREDYVYQKPVVAGSCVYFHDGQPSCLVGHWLHKRGIEFDAQHEGKGANQLLGETHNYRTDKTDPPVYDLGIDADAVHVLAEAQSFQDDGYAWGVSVKHAVSGTNPYDDEEDA